LGAVPRCAAAPDSPFGTRRAEIAGEHGHLHGAVAPERRGQRRLNRTNRPGWIGCEDAREM
jgi:hypothetical protein